MNWQAFDLLIDQALDEDLGAEGDVTSKAIFTNEEHSIILLSKDSGILAGVELFQRTFQRVDRGIKLSFFFRDGDRLSPGDIVARIHGRSVSLLTAERVALNFLGFLSGIATRTNRYVQVLGDSPSVEILDTRKTLPGFRSLSKYAVRIGGGKNHRQGLFDMVLIKDNHIDLAGSLSEAVARVRRMWGDRYQVEVECRSLEEVREAVQAKVDIIMLDNMNLRMMKTAISIIRDHVKIEVSGNVDLKRIEKIRALGVDFISIGDMTHSVKNFDFSLKVDTNAKDI